ncbi:MAG: hypothetical protein Q7S52_05160 [bacterium]|nr:hypothetical protein [bacterium]
MQFIASYWYLWLILMIVFGGYAMYNQLRRMKSMTRSFFGSNSAAEGLVGVHQSFFSGMGKMIVAGVIASISSFLLLIAIVINVAQTIIK